MCCFNLKQKIIGLVIFLGVVLIALFNGSLSRKVLPFNNFGVNQNIQSLSDEKPRLLSTKPENHGVISPTESIELTFNKPIENAGELKFKIDPTADVKVVLSDDRKTAKFVPNTPYLLGQSYRILIFNDFTKFDNKERLDSGIEFDFNTIPYNGV